LLNAVAKTHWGVSNDKAISYAEQAAALARELGYAEGEAAAQRNVGIGNWYADRYDAASTTRTRSARSISTSSASTRRSRPAGRLALAERAGGIVAG
jgi:hypothetical protein